MAVFAYNLKYALSGGAANADQSLSLGGILGATMDEQDFSDAGNISGVTVVSVHGLRPNVYNPNKQYELRYTAVGTLLQLFDLQDNLVPGGGINIGVSGRYELQGSTTESHGSRIIVDVVDSLLALSDAVSILSAVSTIKNNLFPNVPKSHSVTGYVSYRCLYIYNPIASATGASAVAVYVSTGDQQPEAVAADPALGDTVKIALDAAGIGDGVSTGVATTIVDELDSGGALAALSFLTANEGSPFEIGNLMPGEYQAIWVERTIPLETPTPRYDVHGLISVKVRVP
jgi:hypothetical protein